MNKLSIKGLGLAFGILWAASMLIMGLLATYTNYGGGFINAMSQMYPGAGVGIGHVLIGTVIGFIDGFVGGAILAWLYNKFA